MLLKLFLNTATNVMCHVGELAALEYLSKNRSTKNWAAEKPFYFSFYWLFNRDPYNGLL